MKRLLIILTLVMFSFCLKGQDDHAVFYLDQVAYYSPPDTANKNNNVIYESLSASPWGLGLRYDRYFNHFGVYTAVTKGTQPGGDDIKNSQYRIALGGIYRLAYKQDQIDSPIATVGLVYHHWLTEDFVEGQVDPDKAFRKWSFELGMGGRIKRFNVAGRADFMQMEITVDLGFNF